MRLNKTVPIAFIFMIITVLTMQISFAADYAVAAPTFIDGKCSVTIWIHDKGERRRIIYTGNYADNLCHVEIPAKQFEKHFSYCMLAGLDVVGSNNFLAQFGGGAGGDREVYWFEWRDPRKVSPTFNCVLNRRPSRKD
jgi:hypothetical protein